MNWQQVRNLIAKYIENEKKFNYRSSGKQLFNLVKAAFLKLKYHPQFPMAKKEMVAALRILEEYGKSALQRRKILLNEFEKKLDKVSEAFKPRPLLLIEELEEEVRFIKGVGPKMAKYLEKRVGIKQVKDLITHFPRDYIDRSSIKPLSSIRPGEKVTVVANVFDIVPIPIKKKNSRFKKFYRLTLTDGKVLVHILIFGRDYLAKILKKGDRVLVSGVVFNYRRGELEATSFSSIEVVEGDFLPVLPVYSLPAPKGEISAAASYIQNRFRAIMKAALEKYVGLIADPLPYEILKKNRLLPLPEAMEKIHFPLNMKQVERARRRLAYDELFMMQLYLARLKAARSGVKKAQVYNTDLADEFLNKLPFELTGAQKRVINEIKKDLLSPHPMNRLLQGDVGSGKTVVATWTMLVAAGSGFQAAMMAPTEVLAEQHYLNLKPYFDELGVKCALLTGSVPESRKYAVKLALKTGDLKVVFGTHALIQEDVEFKNLALVVIDEQHRFGVRQREFLLSKGREVDVLVMTATPIPRTLAITVYGDLELSVLDQMPPGRAPVKTYWVSKKERGRAYAFLKKRVLEYGESGYIVFPLIEESEKLSLSAATKAYEVLRKGFLKDVPVGLLHGQMKPEDKSKVMADFKSGKIKVLISTPVIEVGVDVPQATVMIIEDAQRFGLAQLHQLRGRIGRGGKMGYCFLVTPAQYNPRLGSDPRQPLISETRRRLAAIVSTNDGFKIAEQDLRIRGPGELFGTRQHGLPDLKVASLTADARLLALARADAQRVAGQLDSYPVLKRALALYEGKFGLIRVA